MTALYIWRCCLYLGDMKSSPLAPSPVKQRWILLMNFLQQVSIRRLQCAVFRLNGAVCSVLCAVHNVQWAVYNVVFSKRRKKKSLKWTMCIVQVAVCNVHCSLWCAVFQRPSDALEAVDTERRLFAGFGRNVSFGLIRRAGEGICCVQEK